jgi:hypothetical protein
MLQTELGDLASYDGEHHRAHAQLQDPANYARIESGLTFLGLAGLMDPPRPEVSLLTAVWSADPAHETGSCLPHGLRAVSNSAPESSHASHNV